MRCRLSKLHKDIIRDVLRGDFASCARSNLILLFLADFIVDGLLLGPHFAVLDTVSFTGEILEDVNFATSKDERCHHCFGTGDALLGEEGGGSTYGRRGLEFEDAFEGVRVFGEDGGKDEGKEGD